MELVGMVRMLGMMMVVVMQEGVMVGMVGMLVTKEEGVMLVEGTWCCAADAFGRSSVTFWGPLVVDNLLVWNLP